MGRENTSSLESLKLKIKELQEENERLKGLESQTNEGIESDISPKMGPLQTSIK